jgi:hypothetical protein
MFANPWTAYSLYISSWLIILYQTPGSGSTDRLVNKRAVFEIHWIIVWSRTILDSLVKNAPESLKQPICACFGRFNNFLQFCAILDHFGDFYQVRQGCTWSSNYKSPSSSSSSSSSSDRFRIFSKFQDEFLRTFCRLFDNFLTTFDTFWQLLTTFLQLFDNFLTTFSTICFTICYCTIFYCTIFVIHFFI